MKVLMYCLSSISGGAVAYLRNLSPLLMKQFVQEGDGHKLKFLAHEEQKPLFDGVDDSQVYWVRGKRPVGYRRVCWELRNLTRIVRESESDVLFTPYQVATRVQGARQVLMIRNMEPFLFEAYHYSPQTWLRNHLLRRASSKCLRWADRVIAVSGFAREQLTQGLGIDVERVRTIYHGCPDLGLNNYDLNDRELIGRLSIQGDYILTCGSLLPYRRCEDVIAAFGQCAPALGDRIRLVIAGSGTDRRYAETISQAIAVSPVRDRIQVLGHIPWETMTALYRKSIACVIATEIEACPNIAIESMAASCMIVSSDRQPLPEMFAGCSLEYRARDIEHLALQIQRAVNDKRLGVEMKEKAIKRAKDFSWVKCARETYAALTHWP